MAWCPRCGGPLVDGVCANCSTAAERKREDQEVTARHREKLRRWVETFTAIEDGEAPMASLMRSLLATPGGHVDVFIDRPARIVAVAGGSERTIDLPPSVRMDMIAFIELHLVLSTRFVIERIDGGFRVRLAR